MQLGRTTTQTDATSLIIAYRDKAKAPKKSSFASVCEKSTAWMKCRIVDRMCKTYIKFSPAQNDIPKTECSATVRILVRSINAYFVWVSGAYLISQ